MKTRNILKSLFLTSFFGVLLCCSTSAPPELEPTPITITYEMPTIRAVENYPDLQKKEGITITVNTLHYQKMKRFNRKCEYQASLVGALLLNKPTREGELDSDTKYNYKVTEVPYYEVMPKNVAFKIRVYNHMDRALQLAGTIVKLQVDGKSVDVNEVNRREFLNGTIYNNEDEDFLIIGPDISLLPNRCNIALLLHEIVTETDAAGNPTRRSSFEWFYIFEKETMNESAFVNVKKAYMTPREARVLERTKR